MLGGGKGSGPLIEQNWEGKKVERMKMGVLERGLDFEIKKGKER